MHLRIDTIEMALHNAGHPVTDEGYRIAYAVAADNLRLGHTVIADAVNRIAVTREAWRDVARKADAPYIEVEVVCSDPAAHRLRVETREGDIAGLVLPTWQEVEAREYEPWTTASVVIDTAVVGVDEAVKLVLENMR